MKFLDQEYYNLRNKMVEEQLIPRSIKSETVLDAMRSVPRHLFVPEDMRRNAYQDCALPIGLNQTISQPYIVAFMTEKLKPIPQMKILEIGTGSGYQAAILAYLGCDVYTVEVVKEHADNAGKILNALNFNNVKIKYGNGFSGWSEEAPFDAVIVTAAPEYVPKELISQLKEGGKMILPVGPTALAQVLKIITKKECGFVEHDLLSVRFVPMVE